MKKVIAILMVCMMVMGIAACGGGDALKGTWTGENADYGAIEWTFNGKGKCTLKHDFIDTEGTYTIEGTQVSIKLDTSDSTLVYDFTVSETNLKLTATDGLALDYDLTKK